MGRPIDLQRKKEYIFFLGDQEDKDKGLAAPASYGRMVSAIDGAPREGNNALDKDLLQYRLTDEDYYRESSLTRVRRSNGMEDYTRP